MPTHLTPSGPWAIYFPITKKSSESSEPTHTNYTGHTNIASIRAHAEKQIASDKNGWILVDGLGKESFKTCDKGWEVVDTKSGWITYNCACPGLYFESPDVHQCSNTSSTSQPTVTPPPVNRDAIGPSSTPVVRGARTSVI